MGTKEKRLNTHRYAGVSLGGGKLDKACLSIIEYYPKEKTHALFLSRIIEKVENSSQSTADSRIVDEIEKLENLKVIGVDAPLKLPKCLRCRLSCPGAEDCTEPEIEWMWEHVNQRNQKRKPKKIFTPYTERCVDRHLAYDLEEPFHLGHAMGSNRAPISARGLFLKRRLSKKVIEVAPKLTLWRVGRAHKVMKRHLRFHKHPLGGDESRAIILQSLVKNNTIFLYENDTRMMIENNHAFEAFLCALTAYLHGRGLCEPRPRGFPKGASWVEYPQKELRW